MLAMSFLPILSYPLSTLFECFWTEMLPFACHLQSYSTLSSEVGSGVQNIGFSNFERRVVSSWDSSRSHDVLLSPRASWAFSMSTMCFKLETAMVISRLNFSVDDGSTNFAWIMLKPVQGTQHYYSHEAEGDLDHPCRFSVQREVADLWGWKIVLPGQGFAQVTNGQSGCRCAQHYKSHICTDNHRPRIYRSSGYLWRLDS